MGTQGSHMGALTRWGHPPEDVDTALTVPQEADTPIPQQRY